MVAASGQTEENTTTMTYDSLSRKLSMTDPDMGTWSYDYDKAGNLISQTDARSVPITVTFTYDEINRLLTRVYPDHTVTYTYDNVNVSYSKGKLTSVSDPSGGETKLDQVLAFDVMQRVTSSQKTIGTASATINKTYDSIGRPVELTYLPGQANQKIFTYHYNEAGALWYISDNTTQTPRTLVEYADFTSRLQPKTAIFWKTGTLYVKTDSTYDLPTGRLATLLTRKFVNGTPVATYQNLNYQSFDGKGNLTTLVDTQNGITHAYTYDDIDRLLTAQGTGNNSYSQSYTYDRIGNILTKSDVGTYSYTYNNKPHAVRSAGNITLAYDDNGNMTQRAITGTVLDISWTYDNKPSLIKRNNVEPEA